MFKIINLHLTHEIKFWRGIVNGPCRDKTVFGVLDIARRKPAPQLQRLAKKLCLKPV